MRSISQRRVCYAECEVCSSANEGPPSPTHNKFMRPSLHARAKQGWVTREGSFKSIMVVIIPCRSDRSAEGLAPYSHLSDGRLQLIMVRDCSRLQYLRFLASIPASGAQFWSNCSWCSITAGGFHALEVPACCCPAATFGFLKELYSMAHLQ